MPRSFKKDFKTGNLVAHVRRKDNGVYEIRCQIGGNRIAVSSKNLETAKMKFITKLRELSDETAAPKQEAAMIEKPVTLAEYMKTWLEVVKKPVVKRTTLREYNYIFKNHIASALGEKAVKDIKPLEIQSIINLLTDQGKLQTAKEVKKVLSAMFDYAVADDVITKSPMIKVVVPHFEHSDGNVISREDEKALIAVLKNGGNKYAQAYAFMLYTGLRRSELASVQIIDGWVHVISAKNKKVTEINPVLSPFHLCLSRCFLTLILRL